MNHWRRWGLPMVACVGLLGAPAALADTSREARARPSPTVAPPALRRTDAEWRRRLSPEAYHVTRECGTEPPFTGKYWRHHEAGTYHCVACEMPLFGSDTKYDSGSGWPSFFRPARQASVRQLADDSLGLRRVEVRCARCEAHLGHVFEDGPPPTGLRYCINSAALRFEPARKSPSR